MIIPSNGAMATNETTMAPLTISGVDIAMSGSCVALMLFVCGGNIMTIVSILRVEALQTLANIYVFSLAWADFLVGITFGIMVFFMLPPYKRTFFDEDIHSCVFFQGLGIGLLDASVLHMTLISIDRYYYITRPYLHQRLFTKRNIIFALFCVWTISVFMISSPQFDHNDNTHERDCDITKTLPKWHIFYINFIGFVISLMITIFMYIQILRTAIRQRKIIHAIRVINVTTSLSGETIKDVDKDKMAVTESGNGCVAPKQAWKSIKFFFTVFGFYCVCITPCLIATAVDTTLQRVNEAVYRVLTILALLNSGMNFIIYVAMNDQFRKAFANIWRCKLSGEE